jgi:L-rhamnose-H+ transport protein
MRYLGLSLGMAVALGFTTIIGTLGPPIFRGTLGEVAGTVAGKITLLGLAMTLVGVVVVGKAGRAKESDLRHHRASAGVVEYSLNKGLLIALLSGVMSGCFAWGLDAGKGIRELSLAAGTDPLAQGLPVLCVVLLGGFTTNFIWCSYLIYRHRSVGQFFGRPISVQGADGAKPRLLRNYSLAAFGGTLWYLQFFFYTMGESQMGRYAFSSWTLHMASIILFSTLWGFALKEWSGVSLKTRSLVWCGIGLLVGSTAVIGWGNSLAVS